MKNVKTMNNKDLLEAMAKWRLRAFFAVMAIFVCMALILMFKVHFLYILIVVIPFAPVAFNFYRHFNEVQRRHLG